MVAYLESKRVVCFLLLRNKKEKIKIVGSSQIKERDKKWMAGPVPPVQKRGLIL